VTDAVNGKILPPALRIRSRERSDVRVFSLSSFARDPSPFCFTAVYDLRGTVDKPPSRGRGLGRVGEGTGGIASVTRTSSLRAPPGGNPVDPAREKPHGLHPGESGEYPGPSASSDHAGTGGANAGAEGGDGAVAVEEYATR